MPVAWPCNVFKQKHSSWVLLKTKGIAILKQKPQLCDLKWNAYLVEDHQIFFAHFLEPCCIQSSPSEPVRQPHSEYYFWFCHIHLLQLYFPHAYLQQLQQNYHRYFRAGKSKLLSVYRNYQSTEKHNLCYIWLFNVTLFIIRLQSYMQLLPSTYLFSKHCSVAVIIFNSKQQFYILCVVGFFFIQIVSQLFSKYAVLQVTIINSFIKLVITVV